ncbi:hypothetical protein NDU88_004425 [Pleurodeles waltl]|uniref:Uncharacterized protein n=1 Tax=Pleurodeles waltl TaxID=8319 RepID=A0AAV7UG45_PLEWA|nr:hypothetical protein NDU88_004425 [Pleurodeles waltl]
MAANKECRSCLLCSAVVQGYLAARTARGLTDFGEAGGLSALAAWALGCAVAPQGCTALPLGPWALLRQSGSAHEPQRACKGDHLAARAMA